jgi:hypothetical protein
MEAAYADPGLARFAAWVHETDRAMAAELERRGYAVAETTRAMSLELSAWGSQTQAASYSWLSPPRRSRRCSWDALSPEDLVEGVAELRVAVVDEKPERLHVAEPHAQVARLLSDPAAVWIRSAGDVLDPPSQAR